MVLGTAVILALSRVYQRRWRYVSQRDIEHLVRALVIDGVLLVSIVAIVHPVNLKRTIHTTDVTGHAADSGDRRRPLLRCSRWSS